MPIPTFTPDIPIGIQSLGQTVNLINNNFGNYNGLTAVNHGAPNATNQGKHLFVEMPVFGTATGGPYPTTLTGEGGIFTLTLNGSSEAYYQRDGVGTNYQMTGPFNLTVGPPAKGSVVLFGGLIMKWGQVTIAGDQTFATPFLNNCFGVVITYNGTFAFSSGATSITVNKFTLVGSAPAFYIAIGN